MIRLSSFKRRAAMSVALAATILNTVGVAYAFSSGYEVGQYCTDNFWGNACTGCKDGACQAMHPNDQAGFNECMRKANTYKCLVSPPPP